jgi:hypothetical protein
MFRVPIPETFNINKHHAGDVHDWLVSKGFEVDGVSVGQEEILIESPNDPTELMQTFEPMPSKKEQLLGQLNAIDVANANSIVQLRQAVQIIKQLLAEDATE